MHADHAEVERVRELAGRKGVTDLLPPWFKRLHEDQEYGPGWCDTEGENFLSPDAAALIVTGSLAKWLAGQGIAVAPPCGVSSNPSSAFCWQMVRTGVNSASQKPIGPVAIRKREDIGDYLTALIAAATARLGEMPPAAAADSATASKEHP